MRGKSLTVLVCLHLLLACFAVNLAIAEPEVPLEKQIFNDLLKRHQDKTFEEFEKELLQTNYRTELTFDPTKVDFFDEMAHCLKLTSKEKAIFKKLGFVSVDHDRAYSFGGAYHGVYTSDLPVLVTTDSILHALHRSYQDIMMSLEQYQLHPMMVKVLEKTHTQLAGMPAEDHNKDVDLYLTVARNLLNGQFDQKNKDKYRKPFVDSIYGQNDAVLSLLGKVKSLKMETGPGAGTDIYGGKRKMDWSQFKPRGHYTKTWQLQDYFRALMWMGRADCGLNVLPPDSQSGLKVDSERELRAALNLSLLLKKSGSLKTLQAMDHLIEFMVGKSDNLSVDGMLAISRDFKITELEQVGKLNQDQMTSIQNALQEGKYGEQMIRSQIILSNPQDTYKVPPPSLFQVFGQRYIIDSFVLSEVVFDSIIFKGRKQRRMMPKGLDVMAAFGNDEAVRLLAPELKKWNYSGNLAASRDFVSSHNSVFWQSNLYNLWLGAIRELDSRPEGAFPEVMQTKAWQMKQLQTQLGSWSELRHNTVLYGKQSYTSMPACEYPTGYVEPYPAFYRAVKQFADIAQTRAAAINLADVIEDKNQLRMNKYFTDRFQQFFKQFSVTMGKLEALAIKELKSEPFTKEETLFLKKTIDRRGGGSGPPKYDGWYPDLFFDRMHVYKWDPTVVDVHTNPESQEVLEVGVGNVNYLVMAIDNAGDRKVYVGPVYSYYEFKHPASDRLTDQQWQQMITKKKLPARPSWVTQTFQGETLKRTLNNPKKQKHAGKKPIRKRK